MDKIIYSLFVVYKTGKIKFCGSFEAPEQCYEMEETITEKEKLKIKKFITKSHKLNEEVMLSLK